MEFINPTALFGLLAASIPIIIHFLNLTKLKKIPFSTLFFLKELQKNKIKKIQIRNILILIIRTLIIIFLVLTISRPTLRTKISGTKSNTKTSAVIILDDSYSMSILQSNGSNFNLAKKTIKEITSLMNEGDNISLLLTSGQKTNFTELQPITKNFSEALHKISISAASKTLHESIIRAVQILNNSSNINKEIYILSDFQSSFLYNKKEDLSNLENILGKRIKLYCFKYNIIPINNLSCDKLISENQIIEKGSSVTFSATISNHSNHDIQNTVLSLFINGQRKSQASFSIKSNAKVTIPIETQINESGYLNVKAEIGDDAISYDNTRFTTIYVPEKIPLLVLYDSPEDKKFVEILFNSGISKSLFADFKQEKELFSADLNKYKSVFIVGTSTLNSTEKIKNYVQNGKSLFISPGINNNIENYNYFLSTMGLPKVTSYKNNNEPTVILNTNYYHPIFSQVFENKQKLNFESPNFYKYYTTNGSSGRTLIKLTDNTPIFSEFQYSNGKILIFNSALDSYSSDLPMKSIFVPIIVRSAYYLSSQDSKLTDYYAGSSIDLIASDNYSKNITIFAPNNNKTTISNINGTYPSFGNTFIEGNYKVMSDNNIVDMFAVNHNAKESNTDVITDKEFSEYLKEIGYKSLPKFLSYENNFYSIINEARFGAELWNLTLIITIFLIALEMIISRTKKLKSN